MTTRWIFSRCVAAAVVAALLVASLTGCARELPSSQGEVAGIRSAQAMTPAPAEMQAAPTANPTPGAAATVPVASPTPAPPVPPAITRALADVYANVDWFQGIVTVTTNPGAPNSTSMTLRQWFRKPNMIKLEVINGSTSMVPVGSTFVYDGQTLTFYDPSQNQVIEIQSRPQLVTFLNLPQERIFPHFQLFGAQQNLSSLCRQATVVVDGNDKVAGRQTTIVDITPQNQTPRFKTARLWLDDQTKVPIKAEAIRDNGSILVEIEYQQFDTTTEVSPSEFTFTPSTNATVVTPTPEDIANFANFQATTLQEAQSSAGFPILQPGTLPAGTSQQLLRMSSFDNNKVVAFFYGDTPENVSTMLIEKPAGFQLPVLRGAEFANMDGANAEVYQSQNMVVIDWIRGDTSLTLATTLPRDQALEIAKSVQ